ncbi:hypothetical protein GYN67_03170 [Lactococcus piscium]|uniref:hypothetical protein n=1 Tax=Pseudolactococcus carnosus TaxID=2749961 RepID=UPI001FBAEECE|nr:hypothetical protein [Lactococcus carnosus]MCJ1995696.1 hypothetical protein [Lactococcus carnosus]
MFELFDISKEEQENILKQARRVLNSYRQLKKAYTLSMPQAHTQHYDSVSTSNTSRTSNESSDLIRYLELGERFEKIEQAVERVENNEYLKNKYMKSDVMSSSQLVELSGYAKTTYAQKLRVVLFDFAIAYGIVNFSKFDFKV